jgi:hypothetical protein
MEAALLDIDWRDLPPALMERRRHQLGLELSEHDER